VEAEVVVEGSHAQQRRQEVAVALVARQALLASPFRSCSFLMCSTSKSAQEVRALHQEAVLLALEYFPTSLSIHTPLPSMCLRFQVMQEQWEAEQGQARPLVR